ncbi:MAG: hypothetical protein SGPRY_013591, partial [Prymnesium sp.]
MAAVSEFSCEKGSQPHADAPPHARVSDRRRRRAHQHHPEKPAVDRVAPSGVAWSVGFDPDLPTCSFAWSCAFCGHAHEEQLPYCELCARIRRNRSPPPASTPASIPASKASSKPGLATTSRRTSSAEMGKPRGSDRAPVTPNGSRGDTPTPAWFGGIPRPRERSHASRCASVRREFAGGRLPRHTTATPSSGGAGSKAFAPSDAARERSARAEKEGTGERGAYAQPGVGGLESSSESEDDMMSWHDEQYGSRWRAFQQEQERSERTRREEAAASAARRMHAKPTGHASSEASTARAKMEDHARAWERFTLHAKENQIRMSDVPWPQLDPASLGLDRRLSSEPCFNVNT